MSEWQGCLDLELIEARYLRLMLEGDFRTSDEVRARSLIVRLIDAIFTLERPYSDSTYPMQVKESDLWLMDVVVKELSKEPWSGKVMQPLAHKIWKLLREVPQYAVDLLEAPETGPAMEAGDTTYRAALKNKETGNA